MKKLFSLGCAALVTATLLSSCATNRLADSVEVSLVNLRFDEVTPFETTATFTIRLQNQTTEPLGLEGGVHKIYLNGVYVGSGVSNDTLDIPRLSEGVQTVRVHLRNLSMARLIRDIVEARRVDYRLSSLVYAQHTGHSARVRVSREGVLDLKDFTPTQPATIPSAPR
ncbi:MAG: LEA type 2 family protein [Verrucomicrobia bacterium]|nr:LEA type 2 family protein [Verrucomicrobiota bacterium]